MRGRSATEACQPASSWSHDDHEDGGPTIQLPAAEARCTLRSISQRYSVYAAGPWTRPDVQQLCCGTRLESIRAVTGRRDMCTFSALSQPTSRLGSVGCRVYLPMSFRRRLGDCSGDDRCCNSMTRSATRSSRSSNASGTRPVMTSTSVGLPNPSRASPFRTTPAPQALEQTAGARPLRRGVRDRRRGPAERLLWRRRRASESRRWR